MIENCIEWLETRIELNNRMLSEDGNSDFDCFLKGDNAIMAIIVDLLKKEEVAE